MATKELIKAEIDNLDDEYVDELYNVIKGFVETKSAAQRPSFMSRLRRIKINAPEDFSVNLDLYVNCVSFVVMRQAGINSALTSDQHFVQAGFKALMRRDA